MKTKEIYIVRHGETEYNRKGIVQGSGIDSSLNSNGYRQAEFFFRFYNHLHFDKVFISNLIRTKQTVQLFLDEGLPFVIDENIREISWGKFEGQPYSEGLKYSYREMVQNWSKGNHHFALPDGESLHALILRLKFFFNSIVEEDAERIFICTHGRTLRCMLCLLLNEPMSKMESFNHANTGLFKLGYSDNKFTLLEENNVQHLTIMQSALS